MNKVTRAAAAAAAARGPEGSGKQVSGKQVSGNRVSGDRDDIHQRIMNTITHQYKTSDEIVHSLRNTRIT